MGITKRPRVLPPVYLALSIVVMVALHLLAPVRQLILWPWRWVGIAVMVIGLLLGLSVAIAFKRNKTTIKPGDVSTALVTSGAFRFSRNPIYLGMVLLLIGTALLLGSATPWIVIP